MTLTQKQKELDNFTIHAYLTKDGRGFVLGGDAKVVPQEFREQYNNDELIVRPAFTGEFSRVIDRTQVWRLQNMAPAYARVTEAGTLIIE